MLIDGHVHFWPEKRTYPIDCSTRFAGIDRARMPRDLLKDAADVNIEGVVAVQAGYLLQDNAYLLELKQQDPLIKAVVGWIDFEADDLRSILDRYASRPGFAGVRAPVVIKEDGWLVSSKVIQGIEAVQACNLCLDLWVTPTQLKDCRELFSYFPNIRAVINHCGRPQVVCGEWSPWAEDMACIASDHRAVVCKLSGLIERGGFDWTPADVEPYVRHVVQCFGPQRTMYASNWPMINLVGSYRLWWETVEGILHDFDLSEKDRQEIYSGCAIRCYAIDAE